MPECSLCDREFESDHAVSAHIGRSHEQPWSDKETLREMRIDKGQTYGEMAESLGCSDATVSKWCEKFGIEQEHPWEDEEVLRRLYEEQGLGSEDVADVLGCSKDAVLRWLSRHDISVTTPTQERPPVFYTHQGYEKVESDHHGEDYTVMVHRLVAAAEYGVGEVAGKQVHHKNGVPWDNRPENLEVVTDMEHQSKHTDKPIYKLTEEEAGQILEMRDSDLSRSAVAEKYSVSEKQVRRIWNREAWQWLD